MLQSSGKLQQLNCAGDVAALKMQHERAANYGGAARIKLTMSRRKVKRVNGRHLPQEGKAMAKRGSTLGLGP